VGQDLFFLGCFPFDTFCDCLEMLQSEFIRISLKIALVAQCLLFTRSVKKVAYVSLMFICVCASHRACPCCVCMIIIVLRTSLIYSHKWAVYSSHFCSLTRPPWVLGAQIIFCWRLFLFFVTQCRSWRQYTGWCLWHPFSSCKRCCNWLNLVLWIPARWARIYFSWAVFLLTLSVIV
jgi:hypothetical protein